MSKVKSPQEKKRLSLERDRRNVYGENAKASRKNIPRSKQLSHQQQRRAVGQALGNLFGRVGESESTDAELIARSRAIESARYAFKKQPDKPLGEVIARKRRKQASNAKKKKRAQARTGRRSGKLGGKV